ncbi:MAG: MBL fold metallo-hydrolase [bacterium]|nr:MBL fold metallo-hydrolase [bacterium]
MRRVKGFLGIILLLFISIVGIGVSDPNIRDLFFGRGVLFNADVKIFVLDVGQGDSILIKAFDRNVLIDAGQDKALSADKIGSFGVKKLNLVIATHPHSDHIGGMFEVIKRYDPEYYLDPGIPHTSKVYKTLLDLVEKKKLKYMRPNGQTIHLQSAELYIFPLPSDVKSINNGSVVSKLSYKDFGMLFLGDAEVEEQSFLIKVNSDKLRSKVIKISHHGSNTGTNQRLLDIVLPEIAIISVGKNNSYGHPHSEVIELLKENNIKTYRTDRYGTIIILSDGFKYSVIREKGSMGERFLFFILQLIETVRVGA